MSAEAILSAENCGKPLRGRSPALNPAGEFTALLKAPSWWEGGCCPLPITPPPLLAFGPSVSAPNEKSWTHSCLFQSNVPDRDVRTHSFEYVSALPNLVSTVFKLRILPTGCPLSVNRYHFNFLPIIL